MRTSIVAAVALLFIAGTATTVLAQAGTGFTITDGDVVFTQVNSPTSGTVTSVSGANLRLTGAAGLDHLFENWWWYRVQGVDTRELAFNNATATIAAGNTATTTWTFPSFTASLQYVATDTDGPGGTLGQVVETMIVTNTTVAPISLNLFNYVDYDVNATAGTDSATGGVPLITVSDGPWTLEYGGPGATNYQVTAFATLRGLLTNTVVNDLANTGLPFTGDFTGAFQWVLNLAPNQPITISERLASVVVPEPGALALLGLGALALIRRK